MTTSGHCRQCGKDLPADAPQGLCPQCLMILGLPSEAQTHKGPEKAAESSPLADFLPPSPEELSQQFHQLEILELLGKGGMGAVYKARQKHLDRLVALKILPSKIGRDPAFTERFTREARSLARLSHPHIVTVHDFGQTPTGLCYFLMEYVDGTDLRKVIASKTMTPHEALAIVPQICEALQFAHERGIVHRDIKPENILIDKNGKIKIADFGLARLLDPAPEAYTLTAADQRMGTPLYMAPEQVEHPHTVDHRADIYSLGVVFYEMLTGELPLGRFAPPSQKVRVDVRLDDVVLRTLEKEPELRYQKISEVKTEVETISSSPAPEQPARAPDPAVKPVLPVAPVPAAPPAPDAKEAALQQLRVPGIGLIVTGALGLAGLLIAILLAGSHAGRGGMPGVFELLIISGLGLPSLFAILAGNSMLKGRSYGMAVIGSIIALIPSPLWLLNLIFGIWALVVLNRNSVKAAFDIVITLDQAPSGDPGTPESRESAAQQTRGPGIALIVVGILTLPVTFLVIPLIGFRLGVASPGAHGMSVLPLGLFLLLLLPSILIILAGRAMLRLSSYGLATLGSILALLPCMASPIIGLIVGIWALVVLNRSEVRRAFASTCDANASGHSAGKVIVIIFIVLLLFGGLLLIPLALFMSLNATPSVTYSHNYPGEVVTSTAAPAAASTGILISVRSQKVGDQDFPMGRFEHVRYTNSGPVLSDECIRTLGLESIHSQVNEVISRAWSSYVILEGKHTQLAHSGDILIANIEPFESDAEQFLTRLWTDIDALFTESQRVIAHRELPLNHMFGRFGFGQYTLSIKITKTRNMFDYEVEYRHKDGHGGRSSGSRSQLPAEFYHLWYPPVSTLPDEVQPLNPDSTNSPNP